jgi:hypothetical protein
MLAPMAAKKERKPLTGADVDRLLANAKSRALTQPVRLWNWVQESARAARGVVGGSVDLECFYWIGLYGTLHDIKQHVEENHSGIADHLATFKNPEKYVARLAILKERLDAIGRIRDVFENQDDCVLVQFMRNVHSHPLLDNYAVDVRGDKLKGQLMHTLLGKVLSVEETDAAVGRIFRRYGAAILRGERADSLIARDFARASLPAQEALAGIWSAPDKVNV